MRKIVIKKNEFVLRETKSELVISDFEYTQLVNSETTIEEIIGIGGIGKIIEENIDLSNYKVNFYKWENFNYKKKVVKTWYELLPELINSIKFEATFIKKNKEERNMLCKFEATRYLNNEILTVYDLVKCDYRSINMNTLSKVIIDNTAYTLKKEELLNL